MKNTTRIAALVLMATTGVANAGGSEGSLGVGAEFMLSGFSFGGSPTGGGTSVGLGGPSLNYDAGAFHVGGFLAVLDPGGANNTTIEFGGRFYYHVHSTAMADFGIGGTIGVLNYDMGDDRGTALFIEPGFQMRVFLQANVALSLGAGLAIGAADADGVALIGDAAGSAGFHYYFF
ncbi:MAG: hypothetical protein H0T46_01420 [Deltaproteobacteria bacterium]|nr:hypothetical protein [Deltaproteobacteria bacterium]